MKYYDGSTYKIISSLIPEPNWLPWKFHAVPRGYWDILENQRKFVEWLGKELNIKTQEEWYKVSSQVIFKLVINNNKVLR